MDSGVGTPPEVNSYAGIHGGQEHPSLRSPGSGRKRKLQLEQLVPVSRHKSLHHLDPDESSGENMDESETALGFHLGPEQTDGSSSRGGSSSSSSTTTTMWDLQDHAEMSQPEKIFVPQFEHSAWPESRPEGGGFRDRRYSLDSRVVKNRKNVSYQVPAHDDPNQGVGEPADCQSPVSGVDEGGDEESIEEEGTYATAQELMLSCCEDVGLHTLGLPSAEWNIKQDALQGAVRPTIDKEFEEYFSMLML